MTALKYQLKNIRREKLCILTFLLPIVVGIAIRMLSGFSFASVAENSFGILENDLDRGTVEWLSGMGNVTAFESREALKAAVNEPSTQMIGVLKNGDGLETMLSGDELSMNVTAARTLPALFSERDILRDCRLTIVPDVRNDDGLKALLTALTLVTAMFMGCTFNAMSIIGEKEDGVASINEILPITAHSYIVQKISLGFIGAVVSAAATALLCMNTGPGQIIFLIPLLILSSLIAALAGLFIGRYSNGLMTGIVCIKITMIAFLAPPVLVYLAAPKGGIIYTLSYLLPSGAAFYGLMELMNGSAAIGTEIGVLAAHCVVWYILYLAVTRRGKGYA